MQRRAGELTTEPDFVVGIGASAGGLQALEEFFSRVHPSSRFAFIVVQHLSPDHRSMMVELLGRRSELPVVEAADGAEVLGGTVTVLPPGHVLQVDHGHVRLTPRLPQPGGHWPIDDFFESLATSYAERSVAVVLTGTGSDGARGVGAIRDHGGIAVAQDPATAAFDGMPRAAIATGAVSMVGTPSTLADAICRMDDTDHTGGIDLAAESEADLQQLVAAVQRETGIDFTHYKRATVERRIARRAAMAGTTSLDDYVQIVTGSADERVALCRDLLIGVTEFFRDEHVWTDLRAAVIEPALRAPHRTEFRAWVAGCSTGEEAYTLAMLVREVQAELDGPELPVKIFATDVDQVALARAASGVFSARAMQGVSAERRRRFFSRQGEQFVAGAELRRLILFTPHDLTANPPFTKLDLVTCRNVLIYMDQRLQQRVMGSLRFGLRTGGALVLSPSEHPAEDAQFEAAAGPSRIYRAVGERPRPGWLLDGQGARPMATGHPSARPAFDLEDELLRTVRHASALLLEQFTPPAVLVDAGFRVHHVYGSITEHLRLPPGSVDLNLLDMVSPEVAAVLSPGLGRALGSGEPWLFRRVAGFGGSPDIAVRILPVAEGGPDSGMALVCFERLDPAADGARVVEVDDDAARHLAELSSELQRSQASRQQLIEELSVANEELQATNEELQATNEELQATNEELQATNQELHSVNAEHERQIVQLREIQADLDSLMAATDIGTVFLDEQLNIRRYTPSITEFLPLLPVDVGRPITDLAVNLDGQFLADLVAVRDGAPVLERSLDTPHGPVLVRILPYHVRHSGGVVITFTDVTAVRRNYDLALRVLDALPAQVAFVAFDGTIRMVNAAWERVSVQTGASLARTGVGANYFEACEHDEFGRWAAQKIREVMSGELSEFSCEYPCHAEEERWFNLRVTTPSSGGAVVAHFDVTEQKRAEQMLRDLATTDHLTAALNRRGLDAQLGDEIERSGASGIPLAAVMLDCDDFKRINDRLGHTGGDLVLATVARRITDVLRSGDSLARVGGDEFLLLLPQATTAEAAVIAERVRLAVCATPVSMAHDEVELTVSAAVVEMDAEVRTLEQLLDRCRFALRQSKLDGKNRVSLNTRAGVAALRSDAPTGDRAAILAGDEHYSVVAQPILRLTDGSVAGFELLTRMVAPPYTPPSALFRAAMEDGLLAALDERCLRRALAVGARFDPAVRCHVNVYPSTLLQFTPHRLVTVIAEHDVADVCIELSEQQILADPRSLVPHRRALRDAGVTLAVDDVGFGRTSLETLLILEPEIVKIDVAYVRGVGSDPERQRQLRRLVQVAAALGAHTIAEGIETAADAEVVTALGVEFGQGYHLGRPLPLGVVGSIG